MNIAEILKNAPNGTKLYSPIFGEVILTTNIDFFIEIKDKKGNSFFFDDYGRYHHDGEVILFPSKENHDWSTFKVEMQFPTTYGECCKALGVDIKDNKHGYGYKSMLLEDLQKLLVCRDAWWKVDDNWKPDWHNCRQDKHYINYYDSAIHYGSCNSFNQILAFRTAEIRDKFLETFRDLIKSCKGLL